MPWEQRLRKSVPNDRSPEVWRKRATRELIEPIPEVEVNSFAAEWPKYWRFLRVHLAAENVVQTSIGGGSGIRNPGTVPMGPVLPRWRPNQSDWMSPFAEAPSNLRRTVSSPLYVPSCLRLEPRLLASVLSTDNGLPRRFGPFVTVGCHNAHEERRLAVPELAADHAPI